MKKTDTGWELENKFTESFERLRKTLNNFSEDDFLKWRHEKNIWIIHIDYLEFINLQQIFPEIAGLDKAGYKNWNQKRGLIFDFKELQMIMTGYHNMQYKYTEQLKVILKHSNIDIKKFHMFWWIKQQIIGDTELMAYLLDKEKKEA